MDIAASDSAAMLASSPSAFGRRRSKKNRAVAFFNVAVWQFNFVGQIEPVHQSQERRMQFDGISLFFVALRIVPQLVQPAQRDQSVIPARFAVVKHKRNSHILWR